MTTKTKHKSKDIGYKAFKLKQAEDYERFVNHRDLLIGSDGEKLIME